MATPRVQAAIWQEALWARVGAALMVTQPDLEVTRGWVAQKSGASWYWRVSVRRCRLK